MTLFAAVRSFGPRNGAKWSNYLAWSGLMQLKELVSFDNMLCPSVVDELTAEDWDHNVHEDFRIFFFRDLDYLRRRVQGLEHINILAMIEEPSQVQVEAFAADGFVLRGYDLVDHCCDISALTNCGGFDRAFERSELNEVGLIDDNDRASQVRMTLKREYPEEPYADCVVWAIWRLERFDHGAASL